MHHITFLVPSARDVHLLRYPEDSNFSRPLRRTIIAYMGRIDATWISDVSGKHHHAALNILLVLELPELLLLGQQRAAVRL